jgi:hypothetical protein
MKIKDLNYYVKFIFSTEDGNYCYSTTDREMLKNVEFHETNISPMDYKVDDVIHFKPETKPFKITNIWIRQLVEDTEVFNFGFDSEGCTHQQGIEKEFLFTIQFTIKEV